MVEPDDRSRAKAAARLTLDALGRTGWGGAIRIESNVPVQWGCGSSTTDVLATIRAVSDAESLDAYRWLAAHEGVFCEPSSAASVAGVTKAARAGELDTDDEAEGHPAKLHRSRPGDGAYEERPQAWAEQISSSSAQPL